MIYHQDISMENRRINEYMQNIVSNNNHKCECCPYGHHVNVDFVNFAKDLSNSHNELQKIRRYQRKLERTKSNQLNEFGMYSTFSEGSIVLNKSLKNDINYSSSESNSSEFIDQNTKEIEMEIINSKEKLSSFHDIVFISNNLNDCSSRSNNDSHIRSLIIDKTNGDIFNEPDQNLFKNFESPNSNSKNYSYSSKSFVISYEHLMSIRDQMSASLKRVQELESEVKNIHLYRQKIDSLTKENHQLKCELIQEKEKNEFINTKSEFNRKINEIASNWRFPSDLPNQLIPNLERIFDINFASLIKKINNQVVTMSSVKSKSIQTDVNGSTIIDTLSYFSTATKELEIQINHEDNPVSQKVRKRNFGVTVRPTHHNFTQQITPINSSSLNMYIADNETLLVSFIEWLTASCNNDDIDHRIGLIIYNVLINLFSNSYRESIELLRYQLIQCSHCYKVTENKLCQTSDPILIRDMFTQTVAIPSLTCQSVQVVPELQTRYTHVNELSTIDHSTSTPKITYKNRKLQINYNACTVVNKLIQTDFVAKTQDFGHYYKQLISHNDISSTTDQYLIDDMIAEQIEHSIELIRQELKLEFTESPSQASISSLISPMVKAYKSIGRSFPDSNTSNINIPYSVNDDMSKPSHALIDTNISSVDINENQNLNTCNSNVGSSLSQKGKYRWLLKHRSNEYNSPTIDTLVCDDRVYRPTINLHRSEDIHFDFYEDHNKNSENVKAIPKDSISNTSNCNLKIENHDEFEDPASTGSSPMEATYYSLDSRIEFKMENLIEEQEQEHEDVDLLKTASQTQLSTACNKSVDEDEHQYLEPSLPQAVEEACELLGIWMNDSTTTCSKDLNDSLATIRQFWFEITANSSTNLKYYIDKFSSFHPTLLERIVNMTDSNGNTCMHYAVSEGRWSTVRMLLQTGLMNINKTNNAGYTVLMLVAISENIDEESLKILINESQIDKQSLNDTQQTALMIAASQGKNRFVQLLLEKGAAVNITDIDGSTALMCACDNGHLEVVRLLLARPEIDTELEDNAGCNAMKVAMDNSHKDIALLIFARNNLHKMPQRSKRRSGSNSHPTSPLNQRKLNRF